MNGKQLNPEENTALRELVRTLIADRFDGVIARAAKEWGVSGPFISEFLNGGRGAGMKLLDGLQRYTGRSLDSMLGRRTTESEGEAPILANARGWAAAEASYRARHPNKYPPEAYALARGSALTSVPDPVDEDFVADIVMVLWKHHRDPSIAAKQQRRLEGQAKAATTRATKKPR